MDTFWYDAMWAYRHLEAEAKRILNEASILLGTCTYYCKDQRSIIWLNSLKMEKCYSRDFWIHNDSNVQSKEGDFATERLRQISFNEKDGLREGGSSLEDTRR